jgi:uncharacterized protein
MFLQRTLIATSLILGLSFIITKTKSIKATQPINTTTITVQKDNTTSKNNPQEIQKNNELTIRKYFKLLSEKRMEEWLQLWHENGKQDMPYSPKGFPKIVEGKTAIAPKARLIAKHYSALPTSVGKMEFPDLKIYPTNDPNTLWVEFNGEIEVLATKKQYNNNYAGLFQFRDRKVILFREYYNPIVFTEAFGSPSGFN